MGRVEKSIIIKAPPEKVWELLALDRFQDWDDRALKTMKSARARDIKKRGCKSFLLFSSHLFQELLSSPQ